MLTLLVFLAMHPFHRSLAEVQWNAQTDRYEVALRVDPRDLENGLARDFNRRVPIDQLDRDTAEKLLTKYLGRHLKMQRGPQKDAKAVPMHWVGYELDERGKYVWIYFEWQPPAKGPLWIRNELFMRVEPTHISTLVFPKLPDRPGLAFTKRKAVLAVPGRSDADPAGD